MKLKPSPFSPRHFPDLPNVRGVRSAVASRGFYKGSSAPRDDVFLFAFDEGTVCAGVYTRSATASADVDWCREALLTSGGKARALVVNAGNSNAFTGPKGKLKNEATLAAMCATLGLEKAECYLAATGVIGEPLEDANFVGAIVPQLAAKLAAPDWEACARAIMTTDTYPKGATQTYSHAANRIQMAGICKGSGMIAPNMGTMLAYIFTDAAIAPDLLDNALREAARNTFNCATVDGDTSTSDTLMVFATGRSGAAEITSADDPHFTFFKTALEALCLDLAHQLVKDGEGATKFVEICVKSAESDASAKRIACAIANSPLVKTALAAGDANWGRVVMAAGKAMEPLDKRALAIWFGDHCVARDGARTPDYDEATASAICAEAEIIITVDVGTGQGSARIWTCDLTHGYIEINGAYRT